MPITINDKGINNVVVIEPDVLARGNGRIEFRGDNNVLSVQPPILLFSGYFFLGDGAVVEIGQHVVAGNLFVHAVAGSKLSIGNNVGFNGLVRLLLHESGSLTIGDESLFGGEVDITISDMHSILDKDTRVRLNPAKDVVIGKRVWIGQRCTILKGTHIGDGSVIGANSLVSSRVPSNCLAAGNPARLLRVNVEWDQRLL